MPLRSSNWLSNIWAIFSNCGSSKANLEKDNIIVNYR